MTKPKPEPFVVEGPPKFGAQRELRCSFCWKPKGAVRHLVGGPGEGPNQVFICDECVALCAEIMVRKKMGADGRSSSPVYERPRGVNR